MTNPQVKPPKSGKVTIIEDGLSDEERAQHVGMNRMIRAAAGLVEDPNPPPPTSGMNAFLRGRGTDQRQTPRLTYQAQTLAGRQKSLLARLFKDVKPDKKETPE